jgi:Mn2+/Fe2+ NRAMP family transporter
MVQQLTVRLSVFTGRSYVKLVREYFGLSWVWLVVAALAIATLDSLVTESPPSPASVSDHFAVVANWI